ncbi:Hypothetical_protein [Hexamita inflata]|uniref:Hypothetical_protein n=1 Tax=Hexamita inflata TaxID=28002 RepID=A0ABP1HQ65_9EUKA
MEQKYFDTFQVFKFVKLCSVLTTLLWFSSVQFGGFLNCESACPSTEICFNTESELSLRACNQSRSKILRLECFDTQNILTPFHFGHLVDETHIVDYSHPTIDNKSTFDNHWQQDNHCLYCVLQLPIK